MTMLRKSRSARMAAMTVAILGAVLVAFLPTTPAAAAPATIHPGTLGTDQHGNPLQLHGLGIIKVGDRYYGFGEDKTGESSANTAFQHIPATRRPTWPAGPMSGKH